MSLRVKSLATGSSGNAILVQTGETKLLVDCGLPTRLVEDYLQRSNVDPATLSAILLTHEHTDHIQSAGIIARRYGVPVVANRRTLDEGAVALGERFSASRFWDEVRRYGATTFNGLGAVMPILMKQPERPDDLDNPVRFVLSAGCPADIWRDFEERFGVRIYEGYGAVDGGSVVIANLGTAPTGSMGKPIGGKCRVIDERGMDVPPGQPGELIYYVGRGKGGVEYYRNEEATSGKVRDGWLYTGDLVWRDEEGYLYFVGRITESMRVKGENVSAMEVEQAVLKHPDVLECAVYAVPSELAEDEIMAAVVPVEGRTLDPMELRRSLEGELARFALPRYWRVLPELPKTETHRVIKRELERQGITPDAVDAEKEMAER